MQQDSSSVRGIDGNNEVRGRGDLIRSSLLFQRLHHSAWFWGGTPKKKWIKGKEAVSGTHAFKDVKCRAWWQEQISVYRHLPHTPLHWFLTTVKVGVTDKAARKLSWHPARCGREGESVILVLSPTSHACDSVISPHHVPQLKKGRHSFWSLSHTSFHLTVL